MPWPMTPTYRILCCCHFLKLWAMAFASMSSIVWSPLPCAYSMMQSRRSGSVSVSLSHVSSRSSVSLRQSVHPPFVCWQQECTCVQHVSRATAQLGHFFSAILSHSIVPASPITCLLHTHNHNIERAVAHLVHHFPVNKIEIPVV
jgi:hypothetical protein